MLQLEELENLNQEQIRDLLLDQGEQPFEIYIPKSTQPFFSESQAIAMDYAKLAYAGQCLSDISEFFDYEEVQPEEFESVLFQVKISDLAKLAEALLEISYGYINDPEDDEFDFDELVEDFLDKVKNGKISPACGYFIEVYKDYMTDDM